MHRGWHRRRLGVAAPSTDPYRQLADPVPSGRRWYVQRVGVIDETNAATYVRIVVMRGSEPFYLSEQKAPAANTLYDDRDPLTLSEGEQIGAEWSGHTAADALKLYLSYREELVDEGGR